MKIICLVGKAGSGKDTAAKIMVERYGFVALALADPLKRFCRDVFDFSEEQLWGPSERRNAEDSRYPRNGFMETFLTPREALQLLGTEWGRRCYEDVWAKYALRMCREIAKGRPYTARGGLGTAHYQPEAGAGSVLPARIVVTDVRFPNEVKIFADAEAVFWKIVRPDAAKGAFASHASETEQDSIEQSVFQHMIWNDGTLEDFEAKIRLLMGWRWP